MQVQVSESKRDPNCLACSNFPDFFIKNEKAGNDMTEHAWPITFGFLMIALLFVLMLFVPPSEQLARYWVTALIVGLILTTIFWVEDFDISGWLRSRREYRYDPYAVL